MQPELKNELHKAADEFSKKMLVFTDELKDYDERQYAGFIEGAKWMLEKLSNIQSPVTK